MRLVPLAILCLLFMTACSSSITPPSPSAEILMNEGETFFAEKRYDDLYDRGTALLDKEYFKDPDGKTKD